MRVLLLGPFPPPHGGVQTNLVAIRSFLRKQGVPCAVINITRHRKPDADEVYYPKDPAELIRLLARLKYDVIHLHIGGMLSKRLLALSLICARWPRAKSVLSFHSGGFPSTPQGQSLGPASLIGFVLGRFDGAIAVNEEILHFLHKIGVAPQRTRLISPYTFLANENEALSPQMARFFADHNPVLISVGLLEPEYDLPLQIDALARLRDKQPQAGLLLLGSGSIEKEVRARINALQCEDHILLPGDVPHGATIEAISRARVMLRTTWYDGDAISVREAMQVGTPVIATDNAMRPQGVRLIPKSDLAALLRAIEEELRQPLSRKEGAPGDETSLQETLDFYRDLLAGRMSPKPAH
jgi:glycogen synthase